MNWWKGFSKDLPLIGMMVPGFILIILFNYIPILGSVIAFKDFKMYDNTFFSSLIKSEWVAFDNFKYLFRSSDMLIVTRNTIAYNFAFIIFGNLFSMFLAIGLNEIRNKKLSKAYQNAMLLPYFLSWIIMSYLFYGFLSADKGIINMRILEPLGLDKIEWYSFPKAWPFILILANILKYSGYNAIIYLASIMGLDEEIYEAAVLDGCSRWKKITKITLPLLSPIVIIMVLFGIGRIFKADFGLFYQIPMNSGALFDSTNVLDTYVYRALMKTSDIGMSSAAGLYQSVVGLVLVLLANYIVRKIDKEKALF